MSMTRGFREGTRRGTAMALDPQKAFARERREAAQREDTVTIAWRNVGRSMRKAIDLELHEIKQKNKHR